MHFVTTDEGGDHSFETRFRSDYAELKRWAMQITSFDDSLSDDILHDAYLKFRQNGIQFPKEVADQDGYIYVTLRNTYRSHMRRSHKKRELISLGDVGDIGSKQLIFDPRPGRRAQDELLSICRFLCSRKTDSIAGSLAILKFFHGYFPSELSKIANRSRNAVEARISRARREIAEFVHDGIVADFSPERLSSRGTISVKAHGELFGELRQYILEAVKGSCIQAHNLKQIYAKDNGRPDRGELSHIVSCERCLDLINEKLHLPKLSERHPLDNIRPQTTLEGMQLGKLGVRDESSFGSKPPFLKGPIFHGKSL